ncbi:hypothetical protein BBD42_01075 [Paenibacillus sp. BIHB 4019]|uniref:Uncharacterized protein n=1 Tax=Paenibacillus sp. BIHB 4019 TaxID=1870819 RepID=A0A1B2DS06_9BACL|nr:hypothetical protein BBD42_01075 [Paenibacillus sp. BIHB 4019]
MEILSLGYVIQNGIEFAEDVCFSGTHGQLVFDKPEEEGGKPLSGLLYEKRENGKLAYYAYYKNGISDGDYINFYESGEVASFQKMSNGVISGKSITWFENGNIRTVAEHKYGFCIMYKEWNENKELIKEKIEPNEFEKKMIEKYDTRAKSIRETE